MTSDADRRAGGAVAADGLIAALTDLFDGLSRGASRKDYDRILESVSQLVTDRPALGELVDAARRAHGAMDHHRQREHQMSALYDTARDLVSLRDDVDATLEAVVRRAHQVVPGADATYLCLRDESTGGFYVLASMGLISPAFKEVRVPPGRGMSGQIERTRTALRTTRYFDDISFEHDDALDAAQLGDGLNSVVGVPLIARDQVLGVLFAGNRRERMFTEEEAALLTAFADSAAVAIDNATLFTALSQSRAETQAHNVALERSSELHDRLAELVIRGGQVSEVADALSDVFDGQLLLVDRQDAVLAYRGEALRGEQEPAALTVDATLLQEIGESRESGRCVVTERADQVRLVAAIGSGASYLGALVLQHSTSATPLDVRTLERAAQIIALLTLRQDSIVEAEERVRGELLSELLSGSEPLSEAVRLRARARHLDLGRPQIVVAVQVGAERAVPLIRRRILDIARNEGGIAGDFAGTMAIILPGDDAAEMAQRLHQRLRHNIDAPALVCAVPPVDPTTGALAQQFTAARRGVELLQALGRTDAHSSTQDLALYGVLFDPSRAGDLHRFIDTTLGRLLEHDRAYGSDLVNTLNVFFASGANGSAAARRMFVHPNTITKRFERVASLLGPDWQDEDRMLSLRIALRLHGLSESTST